MSKCSYAGCTRILTPWKGIYPQLVEHKLVYVCGSHDKIMGRTNLMKLAGMTHDEAIAFDTYTRQTRDGMIPISWEDWQAAR